MTKLIIFDLDGVLVHASWIGIYEAYKAMIKWKGKDWRTFFKDFEGFQEWWSPDYIGNEKKIGLEPHELKEAHEVFYQTVSPHFHLMNWTECVLGKLSQARRLAILTNRNRKTAMEHLQPVVNYFEIIVTADELDGKLKPDSFGIDLILKKTCCRPENVVMVGDRPEDVVAGLTARTRTCAVIWEHGLSCNRDFEGLKPDYFIRCVNDFFILMKI